MQFIMTLLHIPPVQCMFSAALVRTAYNWSNLPNRTNSALLGYKCQDIEFILGLKMSTKICTRLSTQMYIPYARHYKPRLVYFLYWKTCLCFQGGFIRKFCPCVWLLFKSRLWWRSHGNCDYKSVINQQFQFPNKI